MPDANFVQPLSGKEIKADYLAHIQQKLNSSCNLRDNDAYPRGYSGTFKGHIELYGLDVVVEEIEIQIGAQKNDPETTVVDMGSEIEQETELNAVRQRSEQPEPVLVKTPQGGEEVRQRRYAPRVTAPQGPLESPTVGGAVEFQE